MVHVYVRPDGLASVIVSNSEYPPRVAHTLLNKVSIHLIYFIDFYSLTLEVMDDFTNLYPPSSWASMGEQ